MESPLLQLQIDALLLETCLQPEEVAAAEEIVEQLRQVLTRIKPHQVQPRQAQAYSDNLGAANATSLSYHPASEVSLIGSFPLQTLTRPHTILDIALTIPKACFYEKDYLNHKYHVKKALWLSATATKLKKHAAFEQLSWVLLNNNPRKQALLIKLGDSAGPLAGFSLRLIPTITADTFPLSKLTPERCNLRPATPTAAAPAATAVAGSDNNTPLGKKRKRPEQDANAANAKKGAMEVATATVTADSKAPTPLYSASILADMMTEQHQQVQQAAMEALPRLSQAVALLKVWASRHGFSSTADGMHGFLLSTLAVHLAQQGKLLLRAIFQALADPRTFAKGLFMQWPEGQNAGALASPPSQQAMQKAFEVVFVDSTGWCNLAAHTSKSALQQVQRCAKTSLSLLDQAAAGQQLFDTLFLTHDSPLTTYDYIFHVTVPAQEQQGQMSDVPLAQRIERKVHSIVTQALGKRATLVRVFSRAVAALAPKKGGFTVPQGPIMVGVQADPTAALQLRDIGPPAESVKAATAFRQFWGDRAELRRFQDGNIAEAVVWECGPAERHTIVNRIVEYALQRHLPAGSSVLSHTACLDHVLQSKYAEANAQIQASRQLDAAVEKLSKQIRGLTTLTLKVVSAQPLSATSRHTAPFYPLPHPLAGAGLGADAARISRCLEPTELLLQLEGSGKWADHPEAFRKMKAALGVQLAQALESSFGLDAQASEDYVDVLTDGFAVRLFLFSNRDEIMAAKDDKRPSQRSVSRLLSQHAQHHGLILGVAGQNPAFPMAARLGVRWVAAHMLAGVHLPVEAIELMVAAAFLPGASVMPSPGCPLAGFVRFLHLLSTHSWKDRPLTVDPTSQLTPAQHRDIQSRFDHGKASKAVKGFCICSPSDLEGLFWAQEHMSSALQQRLVKLATKSLNLLQAQLEAGQKQATSDAIFQAPLEDFDVLIRLRPEALPYPDRALAASPDSLPSSHEEEDDEQTNHKQARARLHSIPKEMLIRKGTSKLRRELLIGFDPVSMLIEEIQERFQGAAAFFVDLFGGGVLALKWNDKAFLPVSFDAARAYMLEPVQNGQDGILDVRQCSLSVSAVLSDIRVLGAGLVQEVLMAS